MSDSTKPKGQNTPLLFLVAFIAILLVIVGLFLPPVSLGERLFGDSPEPQAEVTDAVTEADDTAAEDMAADDASADDAAANDAAVDDSATTDPAAADDTVADPAASNTATIENAVSVTAEGAVAVEQVSGMEFGQALPAGTELQGSVFTIDTADRAADSTVRVALPEGAEAEHVDLYGWQDGSGWVYIPAAIEGRELVARSKQMPVAVAVVAPAAERTAALGVEVLPTGDVPGKLFPILDEISLGTLTLGADGMLLGDIQLIQPGNYKEYVRVTNTGLVVDTLSLLTVLTDAEIQTQHIDALVMDVFNRGYAGVNLDYQGVPAEQTAAFSSFVGALADELHARDLDLAVTLAAPELINGQWLTIGQDWQAIGATADVIYMQMPLNPAAYQDNGLADQMIEWAIRHVDRQKISLLLTANAIDQVGTAYTELPAERALTNFGELQWLQGSSELTVGDTIEVGLTGISGPLEWDSNALTYRYTFEQSGQSHTVWLDNEAALAHRMRLVDNYMLRGALVRGLGNLTAGDGYIAAFESLRDGTAPDAQAAAVVWSVLDVEGTVIDGATSEDQFAFAWQDIQTAGTYTLTADFAIGDKKSPLGGFAFTVNEPVVVEEPTPDPVGEDTAAEDTSGDSETVQTIEVSPGDADGVVTIATNFRQGPGFYYAVNEVLDLGTRVDVLARDSAGEWLNVIPIGSTTAGWVFSSLVQLNSDVTLASLPVAGAGTAVVVPTAIPQATATPIPQGPTPTPLPQGPWFTTTPAPTAVPTQTPVPPTPTTVVVQQPPPAPPPAAIAGGFELGGQTHSFANPALMSDIGMNWVKFQHKWSPGDTANAVADRVRNAKASGFKVLLSMPGSDTYPSSINFSGYIEFLRGVAALNPAPDAIEIWNEMNIDFEWPAGQINPTQYVNSMLRPAYQAIKSQNSNIIVVSGAPAPTGFDNNTNAWADDRYMRGVAAAGGGSFMDCVGVHYNAGATSPRQQSGHPADGGARHYSWYFQPTLNMYYNAFGGSRPLCITELGFLSTHDYGGTPSAFNWASQTTVAQHAQWLSEAVSLSASSGNVRMLIIFNVDFTHFDPNGDPQAGYALVRPNGGCPACPLIKSVMGR